MPAPNDPDRARTPTRRPDAPFAELRRDARLRLLRMHHRAGVGHIGGNLSALDSLLVLHHRAMCDDDVFVLAKGHAAGALYVVQWSLGMLGDADLDTFHGEGSLLSGHPAPNGLPGIPVATGSLGHGLPVAAGIALARKLERAPGRVFCLCSDGEWQEGSNWEALVFAHRNALSSLVVLIDANGLQGFGATDELSGGLELAPRLRAFGMATSECDGHDADAIAAELARDVDGPRAIVLHTVKGKGVSFMENELAWHYLPLDDALYERARSEVERA